MPLWNIYKVKVMKGTSYFDVLHIRSRTVIYATIKAEKIMAKKWKYELGLSVESVEYLCMVDA